MFFNNHMKLVSWFCALIMLATLCLSTLGCGSDTTTDTQKPTVTETPASTETTTDTETSTPTTREVTNQDGTTTTVPYEVTKVACLYGPSFEKVGLLGAQDTVVMAMDLSSVCNWVPRVFSVWEKGIAIPPQDCGSPNIETLLENDVEVIFFWNRPEQIQKFEEAGIACIYPGNESSASGDYLFDDAKNLLRVYADALGGDAQQKADDYCAYFDEKKAFVEARTADIPDSERPSVYFAVRKALQTVGRNSNIPELVRLAGGKCVSSELDAGFGYDIVIEQLLEWDPEYIILDHCGSPMHGSAPAEEILADIADDSRFDDITAIKNGDVYLSPTGVFMWDEGQQMILQLMWLAKIFQPDLFEDINMADEIQEFYARFFDCELTDEEAELLLSRMPPE